MVFEKRVIYKILERKRKYFLGEELGKGYKNDIEINEVSQNWQVGDVVEFVARIEVEKNQYGTKVKVIPLRQITEEEKRREELEKRFREYEKEIIVLEYEGDVVSYGITGGNIAIRIGEFLGYAKVKGNELEKPFWEGQKVKKDITIKNIDYKKIDVEVIEIPAELKEKVREIMKEKARNWLKTQKLEGWNYEVDFWFALAEYYLSADEIEEIRRYRAEKKEEIEKEKEAKRQQKEKERKEALIQLIQKLANWDELLEHRDVAREVIEVIPIYNWREIAEYEVSPDDYDEHVKEYKYRVDLQKLYNFLKENNLRQDWQKQLEEKFAKEEKEKKELQEQARKEKEREETKDEIAKIMKEQGERPEPTNGLIEIEEAKVYYDTFSIYGTGERIVEDKQGYIWYLLNNGMDGDDWIVNNVATGGAGAIGWRVAKEKVKDYLARL